MGSTTDLFKECEKAEALLSNGDLRGAADLCKHILDRDPDYAYGHYIMSLLFKKTGDLDKAITFADMAAKGAPNITMFHTWLGELWLQKKDYPAAEQTSRKTLAMNPNNVDALGQLFASLIGQQKKKRDTRNY